MVRIIEVPLNPESKQDLVDVLQGLTGFIQNERVAAYNEGLDAGYEGAAKLAEAFRSDNPQPTVYAAIAREIRALKDER